jgi:hypothetical protein
MFVVDISLFQSGKEDSNLVEYVTSVVIVCSKGTQDSLNFEASTSS